MAKRRKKKHKVRSSYITFKLPKKQAVKIPNLKATPKKTDNDYKRIRSAIRKSYSETLSYEPITTAKPTYTTSRKKNRKEARRKRKEKKQKLRDLQQKNVSRETSPEPDWSDIDFSTGEIVREPDTNRTTETLDLDDTENYIEDLIAECQYVADMLIEEYSWHPNPEAIVAGLRRAEYWLEESLQLPYDTKIAICHTLEGNNMLEEVREVVHYRTYTDTEEACEDIASTIQAIIESAY